MKSTTKSAIVTTLENRLEQLDTRIDKITQRRNKMLKTIETHNNIIDQVQQKIKEAYDSRTRHEQERASIAQAIEDLTR